MKEIKAYLFDFDGTLADSEPLWARAFDDYLNDAGIALDKGELDALIYGRSRDDILKDLLRDYPQTFDSRETIQKEVFTRLAELRSRTETRIDGSVELLVRLAGRSPVAIVSGSDRATVAAWCEDLGITGHLQFIIGCEETPKGKPDPTGYLMAAERLGVEPGACVVFEDSRAGALAARAAGMTCIGFAPAGREAQDLSAADQVLEDLSSFVPEKLN